MAKKATLEMNGQKILLVYETPASCLLSDLITISCPVSLIGIGVLLQSDAMQWFGFIMSFIVILARQVSGNSKIKLCKSVDAAKDWLDSVSAQEIVRGD